jgi:hypothetical protein
LDEKFSAPPKAVVIRSKEKYFSFAFINESVFDSIPSISFSISV